MHGNMFDISIRKGIPIPAESIKRLLEDERRADQKEIPWRLSLSFFIFLSSATWRISPFSVYTSMFGVLDGRVGSFRTRRGTAVAMDICMRPINGG